MTTFWCWSRALGLILLCIVGAEASWCSNGKTTTYCPWGCCSGGCCKNSVASIISYVFLGIGLVCIIIGLVCICKKKNGQQGMVVQPGPVTVAYPQPGPYGMGMGYPAMPPYAQQPYQVYPAYPGPVYPPGAPAAESLVQGTPPPMAAAGVESKQ